MARNKFDIDEELDTKFDFNQFRRLTGYLKPYTGKVITTVLLMLVSSALALLGPYLVKTAIDEKIPEKDMTGLALLAAIYLAILIINTVCMKFRIRTMTSIGQSTLYNIRKDLFVHLQKLPFAYYDSRPHGKILVRVVNYVNSLSDLLSNGIINVITDMFTLIAIIGFMLFLNVRLALVCLAGLPVLITVTMLVKDLRSVTLASLRNQMGIMLQDTFIFSGTIMDNIKYSRLDATDEEAIAAAKAVKAHDFIAAMPDGYNTEVNERGSRLSVGQRQLISFARALLADPRILILDEATSSIDTKTELALQEGLQRLLKGRTSFIIAHRLSTIKNADKIMYINDGKIMEQGTHDELMANGGAYYHLYTAQYRLLEAM